MKFETRIDRDGNEYILPEPELIDFDIDTDEATNAEPDEAIGLWIDIKTKYKNFMVRDR